MTDQHVDRSDETGRWRPLSERTNDRSTYGEVLYEGVPDHLRASIVDWASRTYKGLGNVSDKISRIIRRTVELPDDLRATLVNDDPYLDDDELLEIVDVLVHLQAQKIRPVPAAKNDGADDGWAADQDSVHDHSSAEGAGPAVRDLVTSMLIQPIATLKSYLDEAGSAWTVGVLEQGSTFGLVRRVDETVAARADSVASARSIASQHLRRAWEYLHRRNPDYPQALDEAVFALEAAARPVVSPQNRKATLGTMIRNLRDAPQNWTNEIGTIDSLADRLAAIWTRQPRHGTDDPIEIKMVTPEFATAAVHEALTIVRWLMSGAVRRVEAV